VLQNLKEECGVAERTASRELERDSLPARALREKGILKKLLKNKITLSGSIETYRLRIEMLREINRPRSVSTGPWGEVPGCG
jgi:hypothetical protein